MTETTEKQKRLHIALDDEDNTALLSLCGKYKTQSRSEIIRQLIQKEYINQQQIINPQIGNTKEGN